MAERDAVLFVSDLHLAPDTPTIAARFLRFLTGPARDAGRLYILGDLFDAWAGDDDLADPFNQSIVAGLRALADSGTAVYFIAGNRDFLVGEAFADAAGLSLLADPSVVEIAGAPVLLTHGDTLCTDDTDYQRFRATVRTPAWQATFLARPLAARKQEIAALRARSEQEKQTKPMALMDVNPAAAAAAFATHNVATMIHGHTHRQGRHDDGRQRRWVLGDWRENSGNALLCTAAGWHWLNFS